MRTLLYYFTGTGNTLAIARGLASALGGAELVPMVQALHSPAHDSHDAIGLVYPVYMFGLPLIVDRFLRHVRIPDNAHIFCVANYGGMQGHANAQARSILAKRGYRVAAAYGIMMPGNYTPLYGAIPIEQQRAMFSVAKERIASIAKDVIGRRSGIMENAHPVIGALVYYACYPIGSRMVPREDRHFRVDERCTKCGLCAKVCPVGNIELPDGHPVWQHRCESCMACLQWCPVEAIQFGANTKTRGRYRHPDVRAVDIIAQKGFGIILFVVGLAVIVILFLLMKGAYFGEGATATAPGGYDGSRPLSSAGKIIGSAQRQLQAAREQHRAGDFE